MTELMIQNGEANNPRVEQLHEIQRSIEAASAGNVSMLLSDSGSNSETEKSRKSNSKFRPNKELANDTQKTVREGTVGEPTLFSKWVGDALTVFMFDNAPLIMILNFLMRKNMSEAQKSMTKAHVSTAFASAEMRKEQGKADMEKMKTQSVQGFMTGSMGAFQSAGGLKDIYSDQGVLQNQFDHHAQMNEYLSESSRAQLNQVQVGGSVAAQQTAGYSVGQKLTRVQEKAVAGELAAEFNKDYQAEYARLHKLDQQGKLQGMAIKRLKFSEGWSGSGKTNQQVLREKEILFKKEASRVATEKLNDKLSGKPGTDLPNFDSNGVKVQPPVGPDRVRFVTENDRNVFKAAFLGNPEISESFINGLGGSASDKLAKLSGSDVAIESKINPADGTNIGRTLNLNMKAELMRSFGASTNRASVDTFKNALEHEMQTKSGPAAQRERTEWDQRVQRRREFSQMINGFTQGGVEVSAAEDSMDSTRKDAATKKLDAISQNFAAARSALDGVSQASLERIDSLERYYAQALQAVAQANAQAMA